MGARKPNNPVPFKRRKTELIFDENKRKEFLTGFHKRKLLRQKVAQQEMDKKLKDEAKRIKNEAKVNVKKLYHSFKPIPELQDVEEENEYDTENVTVKVIELNTTELAKQNNWIGENRPLVNHEKDEDEEILEDKQDEDPNTVPGMELDGGKASRKKKEAIDEKNEAQADSSASKTVGPKFNMDTIKSKKDIDRQIKKQSLKSMKKSKAFKTKERMQQIKNKKKSRRENFKREKVLNRKSKGKGKGKESESNSGKSIQKGKKRR